MEVCVDRSYALRILLVRQAHGAPLAQFLKQEYLGLNAAKGQVIACTGMETEPFFVSDDRGCPGGIRARYGAVVSGLGGEPSGLYRRHRSHYAVELIFKLLGLGDELIPHRLHLGLVRIPGAQCVLKVG